MDDNIKKSKKHTKKEVHKATQSDVPYSSEQGENKTTNNPGIKWVEEFVNAHSVSPIITDKNGNVFFSYNNGQRGKGIETHGTLVSMSDLGRNNWELNLDSSQYLLFSNGISMQEDGTIVVGTRGPFNKVPNRFYAVNSSGEIDWQVQTTSEVSFSPVVSKEGIIFFVTGEPALYSLDKTGDVRWIYRNDIEGEFCSSPVIANDGLIYTLCDSGLLYIFDQEGNVVKKLEIEHADLNDSPFVDSEGILYLPPNVTAYNSEDMVKWVYAPSEGFIINNLLAMDSRNNLYCYANYFRLLSIDKNGALSWETKMRGFAIDYPPIISKYENVYVCSLDKADGKNDSYIQVFTTQGELVWEYCIKGESIISLAVGSSNDLFALTNDIKNWKCKVYCFSNIYI